MRQPPVVVFRVPHVADMLAVSPSTVYRLVRRGELPAVRRGRHIRVVRADLVAWLDGGRIRAMAPHAVLWRADPAYRAVFAVEGTCVEEVA